MQQFNAAFFAYFELNKSFFGEIHIKALLSLLGKKSLTAVIGELAKNLELLFTQLLSPYIQALMRGFPPSTKLPLFLYKTIGTYEYFYAKLKPLLTYRDLKTEVFQSFREFGNTFCFVALLDQVLEHENVMNVVLSAPFLGLVSSDSDTPAEELFTLKQVMLQSKDFLAGSGTSVVNFFFLFLLFSFFFLSFGFSVLATTLIPPPSFLSFRILPSSEKLQISSTAPAAHHTRWSRFCSNNLTSNWTLYEVNGGAVCPPTMSSRWTTV